MAPRLSVTKMGDQRIEAVFGVMVYSSCQGTPNQIWRYSWSELFRQANGQVSAQSPSEFGSYNSSNRFTGPELQMSPFNWTLVNFAEPLTMGKSSFLATRM